MSCLDDSDDHLRWLAPTDLNLDYMGITHLDCVTNINSVSKIYKWSRVIFVAHLFVSNVISIVSSVSSVKCVRSV